MTKAARVADRLLKRYPDPGLALKYSNPLELLVAVILSAQCTDARVNEVTRSLFKKYRSAKDYAQADPAVFEQEIRSTGFYKSKARAVIGCCKKLVAEFGGKVPADLEKMVTLPGVGRKTANMVLGNAFGIPGIAVDTHVLRVSNRLGLADSDDPEKMELALAKQLPKARWTAFSNALILHGRETCTAKKPACAECVLNDICEWPEKTA
ncbi:MAG: endonuclease III [Betaproteobacteria bacterium]|nr:endonuclease III [Betaproteobacteria bacterium]